LTSDYVPIACAAHERLEFAVLKRLPLRLRYLEASAGEREARVMPLDVYTRDGAEWLAARDEAGAEFVVRLDRILASDPI
jgi:Rho-binding antiterminator